jgi:diphthamide biosynthesis protein 2
MRNPQAAHSEFHTNSCSQASSFYVYHRVSLDQRTLARFMRVFNQCPPAENFMTFDLSSLVRALKLAGFERIAVQLHDSQLESSVGIIKSLNDSLPMTSVSLLGDSVTECCLDETSAEHYGSDCIVKVGHTCWFASQRLVSFFVQGDSIDTSSMVARLQNIRLSDSNSPVFLFVESVNQGLTLSAELSDESPCFICCCPVLSFPGSDKPQLSLLRMKPFSSRAITVIANHFRALRGASPRVMGRIVFRVRHRSLVLVTERRELDLYLDHHDTRFICARNDSLFSRLVNRFGTHKGRVLSCVDESENDVDSNFKELMRRYRGVEAVKDASSIGLVVTHCAASDELFKVRDLLALFLRSQGKDVFMFSVNKANGVQLGNFVDIECFVIMSCPETEYFESDDLMADCVSPFEALVAVGSLDWSDYIITDYDEMLAKMLVDPPPRTPRTPRTRKDGTQGENTLNSCVKSKRSPAKIEMGLRGIPSRYVSEPAGNR